MTLSQTISILQRRLQAAGAEMLWLATAESATSGRIADQLTAVAGASEYFCGGIIAYSNEAKQRLLGVSPSTLSAYGAVSAEVAREMAEGGRLALHADACVADTGIAGPGGATATKPVGLFYVALATCDGCRVERFEYTSDREGNKDAATESALSLLKDYLVQCCHSRGANDHGCL